jgi:hypothetical protein
MATLSPEASSTISLAITTTLIASKRKTTRLRTPGRGELLKMVLAKTTIAHWDSSHMLRMSGCGLDLEGFPCLVITAKNKDLAYLANPFTFMNCTLGTCSY